MSSWEYSHEGWLQMPKTFYGKNQSCLRESLQANRKTKKGATYEVGNPRRGGKVGYRLDPPHPPSSKHPEGSDGCKWHFDYWDFREGKWNNGAGPGVKGKIPIE
jgi:hypothetical protein